MNFTDQDEVLKRQARRERKRRSDIFWNLLTGLTITLTIILIGVMLLVFSNPHIGLNPFQPPTMPVPIILATSTSTPVYLPPTWTPTPRLTETPRPSNTTTIQLPTEFIIPTNGPTMAVTPGTNLYPYAIDGQVNAMANIVFHSDGTCDWQGVAGKVVDLQGRHLVGVLVHLTGYYNGKTIDMNTISGGASAWYGDSGYEFILGIKPVDSISTLAVELTDQSLRPISERVIINTYATCDKNLTLVNFKQIR
jgi:hypothetical protein